MIAGQEHRSLCMCTEFTMSSHRLLKIIAPEIVETDTVAATSCTVKNSRSRINPPELVILHQLQCKHRCD